MGASISNAGKEDWTYFGTFNGDSSEHDLPINWKTLYIHANKNSYSDAILLLKDALPSGTTYYANGTNDTMVAVTANTNKIKAINGTAKVYYR